MSVEGFTGLWRGYIPTICQRISSALIITYLNTTYQPIWDANYPPKSRAHLLQPRLNCNSKVPPEIMDIMMSTGWRMFTVSISTIATQPLYVITVRMIGQFVGHERRYMQVVIIFTRITKCTDAFMDKIL
jgi:hypothetical protein